MSVNPGPPLVVEKPGCRLRYNEYHWGKKLLLLLVGCQEAPGFRQLESIAENLDLSLELLLPLLGFLFGHFQGFQVLADLSKLLLKVHDFIFTYKVVNPMLKASSIERKT